MPSKGGRNPTQVPNPSFSFTLLDEIYGSVADVSRGGRVTRVVSSVPKMQQGCSDGAVQSCFIKEKCRGNKGIDSRTQGTGRCFFREAESRPWDLDVDHDVAYFSSTSISSDSSSGGFSSSDTESFIGARTKASCFAPLKLRPVKTHSVPSKTEKTGRGDGSVLFQGNREKGVEPKSKALKDYETLQKVRHQPVSPGGRLASLISSIFMSSSKKKGRSLDDANIERKPKSGQASTCSSVTSFSRTCLNNGQCTHTAVISLKDEPKNVAGTRSARFCPVNVIVGEHRPQRPCSRTSQYDGTKSGKDLGSVRFAAKTSQRTLMQEMRRFEDINRSNEETQKGADRAEFCSHDDDDDGARSCSSSDLFEIDHLATIDSDLP